MSPDRPHRDRKKILFVTISLEAGGAERVMILLLKALNREKFHPLLALFKKEGPFLEEVPEDIAIFDLQKKGRFDFFGLIMRLSGIIRKEKPDAVVSFQEYSNVLVLIARFLSWSRTKFIVSERTHLSVWLLENDPNGKIKMNFHKYLYPKADRIIAVSRGVQDDLEKFLKISENKIRVIHNPVDLAYINREKHHLPKHPWYKIKKMPIVISAGRLIKSKGYVDLLDAFALVRQRTPARLVILGEGEERNFLEARAVELGVSNDVAFVGFQLYPYPFIAHADVFVLSSYLEGFPNVLLEAMACGTPVISTDCPSGPSEIITEGADGLLVSVGDTFAMAKAMERLILNVPLRIKFAEAAKKVVKKFSVSSITKQYEQAITDSLD